MSGHPYILCHLWNRSGKPIQHLISCNNFVIKAYQKWFYVTIILPRSLKIFVNVSAFLCVPVEVNSKEICEEILFPFFQKNDDISIFVEIQG